MKQVEYWRWHYRDPNSGRIARTTFRMTEAEAAALFPDAGKIEGSMTRRGAAANADDDKSVIPSKRDEPDAS